MHDAFYYVGESLATTQELLHCIIILDFKMRSLPMRRNSQGQSARTLNLKSPTKFNGQRHLWKASQKRKQEICEEIESSISVSETSDGYPKGALKKIIDTNIALHPWLTLGMIKNLSQKRRAKKKIAEDLCLAENNVELITCPRNIVESNLTRHVDVNSSAALESIECSPGRPKGTTDIALLERKFKFEQMKYDIVLGWVNKTKRPSMELQEWFHETAKLWF